MAAGPDVTRAMRAEEEGDVDALLRAAFPGPDEAALVRALRRDGAMVREFVQPWAGRIGAYAAISRLVAPEGWFCLAPVAVLPEWQRGALGRLPDGQVRGEFRFGTRLVSGIAALFNDSGGVEARNRASAGQSLARAPMLVVLGDPGFYGRCGFSQARAARLETRYPVDHLLLAGPGEDVLAVRLVYPAAFDGL